MTEATRPRIDDNPLYQLLREGKIKEFNEQCAAGKAESLAGYDFRGLDLKGINATNLDFSNGYFRQTDIRGVDFSTSNLDGASINGAKISGTLFPKQLDAAEITLSLLHGTRMRYQKP